MATKKKVKLATGKVELVLTSQNAEMKNARGFFLQHMETKFRGVGRFKNMVVNNM